MAGQSAPPVEARISRADASDKDKHGQARRDRRLAAGRRRGTEARRPGRRARHHRAQAQRGRAARERRTADAGVRRRAGRRLGLEPRDRRGRLLAALEADARLRRATRSSRTSAPGSACCTRTTRRCARQLNEGVRRGERSYEGEFRLRHKDGHYIHVLSRGFPVRREGGPVVRIVGTHLDITERKRTEAALRESEERLTLAFAGAQEGVWDWNLETGAVVYSSRWKQMLGYADDEIEPHVSAWERLLHPDDKRARAGSERERRARRVDLRGRIPPAPQGRPLHPRAVARISGAPRTGRTGRPHRRHALRPHRAQAGRCRASPHGAARRGSSSRRKTSGGASRARCTISSASS